MWEKLIDREVKRWIKRKFRDVFPNRVGDITKALALFDFVSDGKEYEVSMYIKRVE